MFNYKTTIKIFSRLIISIIINLLLEIYIKKTFFKSISIVKYRRFFKNGNRKFIIAKIYISQVIIVFVEVCL